MRPDRLPPITEPVPMQEIFAEGREVWECREFVRLWFWAYNRQPLGNGDPTLERPIVAKLILPRSVWVPLKLQGRAANE